MMKTTNRPTGRQAQPAAEAAAAAGRRPSHFVYAVRPGGTGKGFWTRIGAAWANRDGEGFSVKLDLVPLDGADIVIRTPRDEQGRDEHQEGGAA